ncbi:MATE family efflux transporter [bacterium]|nr:MATE family efflux transporter [bacterium]
MLPIIPSQELSGVLTLPAEVAGVEHVPREERKAIHKEAVSYGLPSMAGFMVSSFNEMVSLFWLAKIGTAPVAAVTVFYTIYWMMMTFNIITGVGSNSIMARRFGENNLQEAESASRVAFTLKIVLGTIVGIVTLLLLPLIYPLMGMEQDVEAMAHRFAPLLLIGAGIVGASYSVYSAFRCLGMPNMALWAQALGAGINLILNPLLIFGVGPFPELGILGAALAGIISYTVVTVVGILVLAGKRSPVKVNWLKKPFPPISEYLSVWKVGWPVGINVLSFSGSAAVAVKLVAVYGTDMVALFGAVREVLHFGIMSMVGFTLGTSALVGQVLGAKDKVKAWVTGVYSIRLAGWIMLAYGLIIFIFAEWIVKMFFPDSDLGGLGETIMRIMAVSLPLIGIHVGSETVFEGAGHNKPMMNLSIFHSWIMVVPFMYLLGPVLSFGPEGMMWGWTLAHSFGGMIAVWLFYRGSWLRVEV